MTTKYASPLAESQAKLAFARNAATQAKIALNTITADRLSADSAYKHWSEQWPGIARLPDRPTYEGANGLAVHADGEPFLTEDGHQANRPDIYCSPPPSDERLEKLQSEVDKTERKEKTAHKAEIKARAEWTPPENAGWVVKKPKRIAGVQYAIGDQIDPRTVEPRRWERFKSAGLVGHG